MKEEFISFLKTFVAVFVTTIAYAISVIPVEQIISGEVFKTTFITGLIIGAVRTALSITWKKTMPQSFGGKK